MYRIVNLKERIIFSTLNNKSNLGQIDSKEIILDYYYLIKRSIHSIKKELRENSIDENFLNKISLPSKTAQNGLNFFTKDIEGSFLTSKCEEVKFIVQLILILLNENYENLNECNNLEEFFIKIIFPKYKTENLSKIIINYLKNLESLFFNHIYTNVFIKNIISSSQIIKFNEIILKTPDLIKPSQISKSNLGAMYISFSLKEIYDYLNLQKLHTENKDFSASISSNKWNVKFHSLKKFLLQEEKLKSFLNNI